MKIVSFHTQEKDFNLIFWIFFLGYFLILKLWIFFNCTCLRRDSLISPQSSVNNSFITTVFRYSSLHFYFSYFKVISFLVMFLALAFTGPLNPLREIIEFFVSMLVCLTVKVEVISAIVCVILPSCEVYYVVIGNLLVRMSSAKNTFL